jgi:predicted transposase YbfD/YdcC
MSEENIQNPGAAQDSIEVFRDSILKSFSEVKDPRTLKSSVRHELGNILFITLCAVLCGANNLKEVASYAKSRIKWLTTVLDLPHGAPSYGTFWWTFVMLDPVKFHEGFLKWVSYLTESVEDEVYAIDGKALRGTTIKGRPNSFVHMVSIWACSQQLTLGQVKVDGKSNEITAIPKLLEIIDIAGATITIDAMGAQTKIAGQIIDGGGDYVIALKGNQSNFHDEVSNFFTQAEKVDFEGVDHQTYHMSEEGHGRSEKRTVYVTEDIGWFLQRDDWPGLKSISLLISECTVEGKTSIERRFYFSSRSADARKIAYAIRSHWGIESCHWILDVAFDEDSLKARAGHVAENLSLIRKMGLALLKQDKTTNGGVELRRKQAGWDPDYLLSLLGIKF